MFANAIYTTVEGRCEYSDLHALRALCHAMTGGPGGRGEDPSEGPGHHSGPGRHGHRHRGGPRGGGGFPFAGFGPGGGPWRGGRKARRGDIRTAALLLLLEEPRNGYQIMQE